MCGRFSLMIQLKDLQLEFDLEHIPTEFEPKSNIAPGSGVAVITNLHPNNLDFFYWGLIPSWAKDISIARKTFNARSETINEKPSFKNAFRRRRCLIPSTGYYEWKKTGAGKVPYLFSLREESIFSFAGLWEYWMDPTGNEVYSTTIITCPANEFAAEYHDRMPVILDRSTRNSWLEDRPLNELQNMLIPYPADGMQAVVAEI